MFKGMRYASSEQGVHSFAQFAARLEAPERKEASVGGFAPVYESGESFAHRTRVRHTARQGTRRIQRSIPSGFFEEDLRRETCVTRIVRCHRSGRLKEREEKVSMTAGGSEDGDEFDLLQHFGVRITDQSGEVGGVGTTNRSLADAFAGVASGDGVSSAPSLVLDERVAPPGLIAHYRRLASTHGQMDNALNPRTSDNGIIAAGGSTRKMPREASSSFGQGCGMVPLVGSDCHTVTKAKSPAISNLDNDGMMPKLGACKEDARSPIIHAGRDTESKLFMQSLVPVSLENELSLVANSMAHAGEDTRSNLKNFEDGMYPLESCGL